MIYNFLDLKEPQIYFYYVLLIAFLIQLIYLYFVFSKFSFSKTKKQLTLSKDAVSVVICARNEYYSLEKNLPLVLNQNYPDFEVVVVNDASDDDTQDLLKDFSRQYSNLSIVNVQKSNNFFKGKKFPLSLGIKSAKNDILLLTDADCQPLSPDWISYMVSAFESPKVNIVLGYGKYASKKGFLNKLIRFETLTVAIQYFSFAKWRIPYMGVGRNLAYRKSFFNNKKGFINHYHIASGDDDLFVNQNASGKNTKIEYRKESHTISEPETTMSDWVFQKRRHLKTGKFYKWYHLFLLGLFPLSTLVFYCFLTIILNLYFNLITIIFVSSLFIIRQLSLMIIIKQAMKKLEEKRLMFLAPFYELFLLFFNGYLMFTSIFKTEDRWK